MSHHPSTPLSPQPPGITPSCKCFLFYGGDGARSGVSTGHGAAGPPRSPGCPPHAAEEKDRPSDFPALSFPACSARLGKSPVSCILLSGSKPSSPPAALALSRTIPCSLGRPTVIPNTITPAPGPPHPQHWSLNHNPSGWGCPGLCKSHPGGWTPVPPPASSRAMSFPRANSAPGPCLWGEEEGQAL